MWWVALHGYGQLAADFIATFDSVVASEHCVVVLEELSRFYVNGRESHEEVGAFWMTREDRAHEIDDYVAYLDAAIRRLRPDGHDPSLRVLGFSQGTDTATPTAVGAYSGPRRSTDWCCGAGRRPTTPAY